MKAIDALATLVVLGVLGALLFWVLNNERKRRIARRREIKEQHDLRMAELEKESEVMKEQLRLYEEQRPLIDEQIQRIKDQTKKDW